MGGLENPCPWIRFYGGAGAGYRAIAVALEHGWPVAGLAREWQVDDCALTEGHWRITFRPFNNPLA